MNSNIDFGVYQVQIYVNLHLLADYDISCWCVIIRIVARTRGNERNEGSNKKSSGSGGPRRVHLVERLRTQYETRLFLFSRPSCVAVFPVSLLMC